MPGKKPYPFEESLVKLEEVVAKMESGDLSLEESLQSFEQGIRLTRECGSALKQAEQKVNLLMQDSDKLVPFDTNQDD